MGIARRIGLGLAGLTAGLGGLFALGPAPGVDVDAVVSRPVGDDVEAHLAAREGAVDDLREGAAAGVVWADPTTKQPTDVVVVYLHGFSADRHELSPVPERVARSLGANLLFTRLAGHGRTSFEAMGEASVEDWLADGLEAMALADRLGRRTVLLAASTGGTLATWLAAEGAPDRVDAVVLVSPNLGLPGLQGTLLTGPWGLQIAEAILGPERQWEPSTPGQRAHWTWHYPTRALAPMVALVRHVDGLDLSGVAAPFQVVLSPHDQVIDPAAARAKLAALPTPPEHVDVVSSEDPFHHTLAGDALSPATNDEVTGAIVSFLRRTVASAE